MKKSVFYLLVVFAMIGLLAVTAGAETTDAVCEACGMVKWEQMPAAVPTEKGHYHYALTEDVTCNQWELSDGVNICVDLKGHTIRSGSKGRAFYLVTGSKLSIMDSAGGGEVVGKTGNSNPSGGVMLVQSKATCNMYGGTMRLETAYVAGRGVGSGGIVYMSESGTFNMYGGTIQGAQLVMSEYSLKLNGYGAAFYLGYSAELNVYGGQILSGTVPEEGAAPCVFVNSAKVQVKLSGSGRVDEIYFISENDQLTVDGTYTGTANLCYQDAAITQGMQLGNCAGANIARANLSCGDWMLTDEAGALVAIPVSAAAIYGSEVQYFANVQSAVDACTDGYVKLLKNHQSFTVNNEITLDLNGQNADVTVETGNLTVFDSQTDDHTVTDGIYGMLTVTGQAVAKDGYLQIKEDGKLSFHKVDLDIYAMTLRPDVAGVYYRSRILGDALALGEIESFGVALNVYEEPCEENMGKTSKYSQFTEGTEAVGTLLYGIVKATNTVQENNRNANIPVYGRAYLLTNAGTYHFGDTVQRTLRQQVEAVDALWSELEDVQQAAAVSMYQEYESILCDWEVPNMQMAYLQDVLQIRTEKDCSRAEGETIAPGEEITVTVKLTNGADKTQTVRFKEALPEHCETEDTLVWNVTLAEGESTTVSYTVRLKNDPSLYQLGTVSVGNVQLYVAYTLNEVDGGYFVDAVKALSDSTYTGIDLANRLYIHAYTQGVLDNNEITEAALEEIAAGQKPALLNMVAPSLFGGKTMPAEIEGVRGKTGTFTEQALINGDILLADEKVYAYADGLWLLKNGAHKQNTDSVLAALPEAEKYAVLRPSFLLTGIVSPTDMDAPLDVLNDYQKAIIATAEAYLLRGEKLQYSDTRFTTQGSNMKTEFRWQSKVNSPEDCTSLAWGYTNCAAFTYEVYYQALDFALPDDMYTTKALVNNSASNGTQIYHYHRELDSVQTDEEKARVEKEYLELLQPGDIIVILREGGYGHAMLYVGNGNIIHSGGGVYQYTASVGTEVYEASIRRMKVKDYLFNPASERGYAFNLVQDLAIVRPLQIISTPIPQKTINRVENMQGIMAQKLSSHAKSQTVNPGEEMTFTYEIYNTNEHAVTLDVVEQLPANSTYVSGAETVSGNTLSWKVSVPADTRIQLSYKLKVKENTPYGTVIQSTESTVGGVQVKCAGVQVKRTLTATEQAKLIQTVKDMRANGSNTLTGLALVNKLYESATGYANVFASTDVTVVAEGDEGIFAKKQMSTESTKRQIFMVNTGSTYQAMVAPTLYGGYRMWTPMWQHDRTRLTKAHDLQIGDVLISRTLSSRGVLMYLGEELGFVNMNTAKLDADSATIEKRLERLHGYGYYFAILRPSMTME